MGYIQTFMSKYYLFLFKGTKASEPVQDFGKRVQMPSLHIVLREGRDCVPCTWEFTGAKSETVWASKNIAGAESPAQWTLSIKVFRFMNKAYKFMRTQEKTSTCLQAHMSEPSVEDPSSWSFLIVKIQLMWKKGRLESFFGSYHKNT